MRILICFITVINIFCPSLSLAQKDNSLIETGVHRVSKSFKAIAYYNQAKDNFDNRKYQQSIELYKLAIVEDSNFIDALDNLGLVYRQLNRLDSAAYFYNASFEKDPTNATPIHNMAVVAELQDNIQKAMLLYSLFSRMEPNNPEGHFGLSRMYNLLKSNEEALKSGQTTEQLYKKQNSPYIKDCYYILTIISLENEKNDAGKKISSTH